jgi:hypothetical protein
MNFPAHPRFQIFENDFLAHVCIAVLPIMGTEQPPEFGVPAK